MFLEVPGGREAERALEVGVPRKGVEEPIPRPSHGSQKPQRRRPKSTFCEAHRDKMWPDTLIIIIHLLGLAPAGWLAASDSGP
jgi:hypothetical protein